MARISLKEAYDNRDVIAWLVKHEDEIDELMNILKDIDPDGDLTNVVTKTGDQTIDGIKTFIGKIVADCDIIQNGGNYETHAEQVYTTNDYIVMRDGAVSGLGTGQFSGFQVKKYNGSDDGRLVIDNSGVARVGDLGDEQPLLTRDESSDLVNGRPLLWDAANSKAITSHVSDALITLSNAFLPNTSGDQIIPFDRLDNTTDYSISSGSITVKNEGDYLVICSVRYQIGNQASPIYSRTRLVTGTATDIVGSDYRLAYDYTASFARKIHLTANQVLSVHTYWSSAEALTVSSFEPATFLQIIRLP